MRWWLVRAFCHNSRNVTYVLVLQEDGRLDYDCGLIFFLLGCMFLPPPIEISFFLDGVETHLARPRTSYVFEYYSPGEQHLRLVVTLIILLAAVYFSRTVVDRLIISLLQQPKGLHSLYRTWLYHIKTSHQQHRNIHDTHDWRPQKHNSRP